MAKALAAADVIYPGHDRPFRLSGGEPEYLAPFALTITNLAPDREGLRFDPAAPAPWTMPGAER